MTVEDKAGAEEAKTVGTRTIDAFTLWSTVPLIGTDALPASPHNSDGPMSAGRIEAFPGIQVGGQASLTPASYSEVICLPVAWVDRAELSSET